MKDIIALLWLICIVGVTIYLHVNHTLGKGSMIILFAVAILGGLSISNYDLIKSFEGLGLKVETARKEIETAKGKALSEIEKEVAEHKESIAMLIRTGNSLNEKLEDQKTVVNAMINKAESIEAQLKDDQKKLEYMKDQVVLAQRDSQAIFIAIKELSVILTRITYIQAQTKHEFGHSPRLEKAAEIIDKDLNRVLQLMIPDQQERSAFIQELTTALPKQ
ncbi:MAG: hypothetical protein Q8M54_10975 [Desulfobaccales bacterium]|nr:hypothetical protein [Desulfobaccales bacterium]